MSPVRNMKWCPGADKIARSDFARAQRVRRTRLRDELFRHTARNQPVRARHRHEDFQKDR